MTIRETTAFTNSTPSAAPTSKRSANGSSRALWGSGGRTRCRPPWRGIADLSHRGTLRVTGDDRVKWLQGIISNDILPLTTGHGVYSSLLTHKGKMLSYFRVYILPDSVLVEDVGEIGEATFHALRKFLLYGTKAKMEKAGTVVERTARQRSPGACVVRGRLRMGGRLAPLDFLTHDMGGTSMGVSSDGRNRRNGHRDHHTNRRPMAAWERSGRSAGRWA